jgi:hypothetical protein
MLGEAALIAAIFAPMGHPQFGVLIGITEE